MNAFFVIVDQSKDYCYTQTISKIIGDGVRR